MNCLLNSRFSFCSPRAFCCSLEQHLSYVVVAFLLAFFCLSGSHALFAEEVTQQPTSAASAGSTSSTGSSSSTDEAFLEGLGQDKEGTNQESITLPSATPFSEKEEEGGASSASAEKEIRSKDAENKEVLKKATVDLEVSQGGSKNLEEEKKEGEERAKSIDFPAPVGQVMEGITIPQYNERGELGINFMLKRARKLDDHQVEMKGLRVVFLQEGNRNVTIMVPTAVFDLQKKMLYGKEEISVKREDFSLLGTDSTFDTVKRFGTIKGPIHADVRNQQQPE